MHVIDETSAAQVSAAGDFGWWVGKIVCLAAEAGCLVTGNPAPALMDLVTGGGVSNASAQMVSDLEDWVDGRKS